MQNQQGPERGGYARSDLVRWGPILAGLFAAMGFQALSLSLGAGFGVTTAVGAGAAVWGAVTLIIAAFIGGWIAAWSLAVGGRLPALPKLHRGVGGDLGADGAAAQPGYACAQRLHGLGRVHRPHTRSGGCRLGRLARHAP